MHDHKSYNVSQLGGKKKDIELRQSNLCACNLGKILCKDRLLKNVIRHQCSSTFQAITKERCNYQCSGLCIPINDTEIFTCRWCNIDLENEDLESDNDMEFEKSKENIDKKNKEIKTTNKKKSNVEIVFGFEIGDTVMSKQGLTDDKDDLIITGTKGIVTKVEVSSGKRKVTVCSVKWEGGKTGTGYKARIDASSKYDIYIPNV
jgi:hypothetical protein